MTLKIFKPAIAAAIILLTASAPIFAQVSPVQPVVPAAPADSVAQPDVIASPAPVAVSVKVKNKAAVRVQLHELKQQLKDISVVTNEQVTAALKGLDIDLNVDLADIAPKINLALKNGLSEINYNDGDNSASGKQEGNEQVKNYSKSYTIDANDALSIENSYGKVTVNTWAKNEFKVDVQIKADANSDDEAKKMLDNVTINDSKDGSTVRFKTNIGSENGFWSSFHGGKHNVHRLEINYTIYMPAKNDLNIDNRYGAIEIPDMDGKVTIYSAYGSFMGKSLSNQNKITVKYGSAEIGDVGPTALEVGYGSLRMGSAEKLDADISYSSADIGKIRVSGNINLRYSGGLKIAEVGRDLKNLDINSSYSSVKLGLSDDENANFDITTHYGGFDYNDHNVTVTSKSPNDSDGKPHFTYNYKGYLGKGGTEKNIHISTSYGSVKFD